MKTTALFLFILLLLSSTVTLVQATPTTVQIIPASKILTVNETFIVTIKVSPGQEVDTVAIDLLTWNPNTIQCLYNQQGTMFPDPLVWLGGRINNTSGKLTLMVISSPNVTSSPGILCNITFKAKASGISTIAIELFGVARNGSDLPKHILNTCQVTVEGQYTPPPVNPPVEPPVEPPGNSTNQTTPPDNNETIPPDDPVDNDTYIPIDNTTDDQNDTIPPTDNDDDLPPAGESGFFDNLPTTIIIYLVVAIILISIFAYIIVRHFQHRKEEEEDQDVDDLDDFIAKNFGGGDDGETDSGSEL